ncbi:MAG: hypothetical protein AB7P94_17650 [Steroidobacteraceae bacterium]
MIPASRQRSYLQSALYVAIAGILAALLLERLLTYAEAVEKAKVEVTLSRLHSGLYAQLALHALKGERNAVEGMRTRSPFAVLEWRLPEYLGEFDGVPSGADDGRWLFDRTRSELVYVPRLTRHLQTASAARPSVLRFRVDLTRGAAGGYSGVVLVPVEPFRWEPFS